MCVCVCLRHGVYQNTPTDVNTKNTPVPAYSALVSESTLSLCIRAALAYCLIRHFASRLFIAAAEAAAGGWERNVGLLRRCKKKKKKGKKGDVAADVWMCHPLALPRAFVLTANNTV